MPDSRVNQGPAPLWRPNQNEVASAQLSTDLSFDIAIIGGGYSGLWSAFHLLNLEPKLKIAIFEARYLGFGASGRNGGWASTEYPVSRSSLLKRYGSEQTELLQRCLVETIDAIGEFAAQHAPATHFIKSGTLNFARNPAQVARLRKQMAGAADDWRWLEGSELNEVIRINGARAAILNPQAATVSPYELVMGLARYLRSKGVAIFEGVFASESAGGVLANSYQIPAAHVIRATEAFADPHRDFIPLYSLMVATEPLPDRFWDEVGNSNRATFAEYTHLVNYAQRTADGRLAIGGRGATYPFAARRSLAKEAVPAVHAQIRQLANSWFPALREFKFTHAWGGAVAITRDWEPDLRWDRRSNRGRLGGYAGDGVAMSYLAAKTLSHEILDAPAKERKLHFLNRKIRKWEPEPLRYLAVNSLIKLSGLSDREEGVTGRASLLNRVIAPVILR